ncbi:MAG: prenyltransferase [Planctomycetota bacterium]
MFNDASAIGRGQAGPDRPGLKTRLASLRWFALPVSVLPVFIAAAVALPPEQWNVPVLLAAAVGTACLHTAGNLLNDLFDFRSGVDRDDEDDGDRPGRQLVRGQMKPVHFRNQALIFLLLALLPTGYLLWAVGPGVLIFGAAGFVGLYAYTGPPLELKYHAMGEVLIFLNFGPVLMLGAAWAQTGQLELTVGLISIPIGMGTAAILAGNNVRDREEDAEAGIRTIAHFGQAALPARAAYLALAAGSTLLLSVLALAGPAPGLLVLSPLLLIVLVGPLRAILAGRRLADIDQRTARFTSLEQVAVLAAFLF